MTLSMFNMRFRFPIFEVVIPAYSTILLLFKYQLISIGKSPSGTVQVTVISCPELAGPSSKENGMILGRTLITQVRLTICVLEGGLIGMVKNKNK